MWSEMTAEMGSDRLVNVGDTWDNKGEAPACDQGLLDTPSRLKNRSTVMDSTSTAPTSVYRHYDVNDLLLYVGITSRGISRNSEHNTSKDWWTFVVRQEVDHYPTREDASAMERSLIQMYHPPFNKQHNPTHVEDRAAYLAFAAAGGGVAPHVDYAELLKLHGKYIELTRMATANGYGIFRSGPESASVVAKINASPRRILAAGGGKKSKVRTLDTSLGRLTLHISGDAAQVARTARARLKYISQKPVSLRVDSVTIDLPHDAPRKGARV